jgi:uncharacterized membrane protein
MMVLIAGLIVFLGIHSVRIVADGWRTRQMAAIGVGPWKITYSVVSLAAFLVILWGYSMARREPIVIWTPPAALRHANALFMLVAFICLAAAYVPHNTLKARFGHPMLLAVKIWAVGHLLANGTLHDIVLFGAFLAWAVLDLIANKRRDRAMGTVYPGATALGNGLTVLAGVAGFLVFAFYLHSAWIGVNPLT